MSKKTSKQPKRPPVQRADTKPIRPDQKPIPGIGLIHEKLMGRAIAEWSKLEAIMNDLLWQLVGMTFEDGRVLTGRADASSKIAMLRVIGPRYLDGETLEKLLAALDLADVLRESRNFIVHGTWGHLAPENDAFAMSLRPKALPGEVVGESFSHDRMRRIIQDTIRAHKALVAILNEPETSLEK